jgi:hypothetical protein
VPIHQRILEAARRICRERGAWTFGPREIVAALPDLNTGSVRTHVMSRCCVNAPAHHVHRWPYFRRVRRGVYQIRPAWRRDKIRGTKAPRSSARKRLVPAGGLAVGVREPRSAYVVWTDSAPERPDPVVAAYAKDIDRTLVRRSLKMSFEERLLALQGWLLDTEELRGAVHRQRKRAAK